MWQKDKVTGKINDVNKKERRANMRTEYIIVGDTDEFKECLVALAGLSKENAEKKLEQMLSSPNDNDKALIGNCYNLRIKEVESDSAWWNDPFLSN